MAAGPHSPRRRGGARHGGGAAARVGAVRPRVCAPGQGMDDKARVPEPAGRPPTGQQEQPITEGRPRVSQVKQGRLRTKYDVIVLPHQGRDARNLVYEAPKASKRLAYRKNDRFKTFGMYRETDDVRGGMGFEGAAEFEKFVEEGGLLITLGVASFFPAEFGISREVEAHHTPSTFYAPGPLVQAEILRP